MNGTPLLFEVFGTVHELKHVKADSTVDSQSEMA
jgi:hypothetical protein